MITLLKGWKGELEINGIRYPSVDAVIAANPALSGTVSIRLLSKTEAAKTQHISTDTAGPQQYRIEVRQYMTKKASPEFDFMEKWNHNQPMPLRTMVGTVEKETRGMVYMKLHGDIYAERICTCMRCGRALTNPVSQYFGIGPECGGHNYVNPFNSEEELKDAVSNYKKELQNITWEGWIIKSAITVKEEV